MKKRKEQPAPTPRQPRQTYTFEELVAWKARSNDPNEQKKIRRLIRQLRATDASVPSLRRGISLGSGIEQPVSSVAFDPADKSTWPTTGRCATCKHAHKKVCKTEVTDTVQVNRTREVIRKRKCDCDTFTPDYGGDTLWTEDMHAQFIDYLATHRPLHVETYVNKDGVPVMGCAATCCSTKNWATYDRLVAEAARETEAAERASKKLKKAAKKAAKKIKVTKVSSV